MSITAPAGFLAAGTASGIKDSDPDLALIVAESPSTSAAVFTRNQAAAAPVILSRERLSKRSEMRGIIANSGCANAATGELGMENAERMAAAASALIGCDPSEVLVCSTGTIGPQLPMDKVLSGAQSAFREIAADAAHGTAAATAIMTTDSVPKEAVALRAGWTIGGMAKGAGMVRPSMATMLAFITTDADVDASTLNRSLRSAVEVSFNSLNIDGCESTNDSVIAMASGSSGIVPDAGEFSAALEDLCRDLALQMAADAEGASRVVTIDVHGARDDAEARYLGRLVSDSALVRSSFYGGDVNWGRILGALGTSEVPIDVTAITVAYENVEVFSSGIGVPFDEQALVSSMEKGNFGIGVSVGTGPGSAHIVTTDLTPEYVTFNGERS